MKSYTVTVPFAGHIYMAVDANSEEEAQEIAMNNASLDGDFEWTPLTTFSSGNVCYCPLPWQIEVEAEQ